MNLRRHKHFVQSKVMFAIMVANDTYWQGVIDRALELTPEEKAASRVRQSEAFDKLWKEMMPRQEIRQLVEPDPEPIVFTVVRRKDGEIVGTFESLELAQAEIDKAKKAKKATLVLL